MASLLILTQPIQHIIPCLPKVLSAASSYVKKRLYIHLDYLRTKDSSEKFSSLLYRSNLISKIYSESPKLCPGVDVRVLMSGFKQTEYIPLHIHMKQNLENVLIDHVSDSSALLMLERRYEGLMNSVNTLVLFKDLELSPDPEELNIPPDDQIHDKPYHYVAAGGTVDRIHPGHKILLSEAVLRTLTRLTIGVADGPLLKRKVLKELILPCSERIEQLREFLLDVDHHLDYDLVKIVEPMGPTAYDPTIEMLVVSEETKKGVKLINDYRKGKGLRELESYCIKIFDDSQKRSDEEENKFSSSSQRMRLLGTRLKPVEHNANLPQVPYIIGLTGGSASGKTNIGRRLQHMGAGIIDCDKLGHKAYEFGSRCYHEIVDIFGGEILNEDGHINRKILGTLVFKDENKLKQLTDVVWPSIALLVHEEKQKLLDEGKKVIVLDAAVLLEAKWDEYCHEIWVCIIDENEAIRRIVERDGLSEGAALKRISSQMSNEKRVSKANIVFCSFWSFDYTRQQVENAWNILENEGKV